MPQFDRYSRQLLVDQIGQAGQQKLLAARVLIVGMGGLGCQVGAQLAGAGVGSLTLVDHDRVNVSNLHRQILFRESDIGAAKATVARRELASINSQISVSAQESRLHADNADELVSAVDLVIDAADNFATSYLLSDACLRAGIPMISASVNRSFGYLGVFCGSAAKPAPSMRALFPRLPKQQMSCDTVGVTGPAVGVMASLQAQESLKVLLDDPAQLLGRLLYADLWNYKLHIIGFSNAPEPQSSRIELISPQQLLTTDIVIDVRNSDEISAAPQAFSTHLQIPLVELSERISEVAAGSRVVCACMSGQRALIAAQLLSDQGHSSVAALIPGDSPPED